MNNNEILKLLKPCDLSRPYIFVSYSSANTDIVWNDVLELQKRGYNIWLDDKNLDKKEATWKEQAKEAITKVNCKIMLFYVSRDSLQSTPCLKELEEAHSELAKKRNKGKALPFLAIDAENIGNFPDFIDALYQEIENSDYKNKDERNDNVYDIFDNYFNSSNEKQRVKFKGCKERKIDYYDEIIQDLPSNTKISESAVNTGAPSSNKETSAPEKTVNVPAPKVESKPAAAAEETKEIRNKKTHDNNSEKEKGKTKSSTSTGDITYTIYGKEYTDNQSNMMLRVFAKVLQKHPDVVEKILADSAPLIRCASATNYELPENRTSNAPSRYMQGCYLEIGRGIYIGTGMNYPEKLKNIAQLLELCGEDRSILQSDKINLPDKIKVGASKAASGDERYSIYGKEYTGNQTNMMVDALKFIIEKHFDKREELARELTSIALSPKKELEGITYFVSGAEFVFQGVTYSIGTSYARNDKLKQIAKAINICGEDISQFEIEGLGETKPTASKTTRKPNFLDD